MSVTLQQKPKTADIELVQGDELPFQIAFGRNITGYTIEVKVYASQLTVPVGGGVAAITQGTPVLTPDITVLDATAGTVGVIFNETLTTQLVPTKSWRWFVRWFTPGGQTRTLISGSVLSSVA